MSKDVTNFGAVGDGSGDDTQAIRDAADAAGPGGTVHFPPGTYRVGSNTRIPLNYPNDGSWDNLTWSGAGPDDVTIKMAGGHSRAHFVFLVKGSQPPQNVTFEGLTVDGNKDRQSDDSVGLCILTEAEGKFTMRNCRLKSAQNDNLKLSGDMDAEITTSHFADAGYVSNGGHGISPNQTSQTTTMIRRCLFTGQRGTDVDVGQSNRRDWQTVVIEDCVMRDAYRGSLKLTQENAKTTVRNTLMKGSSETEIPVKANPSSASIGTVALENVVIDGAKWPGIDLPVPGTLELSNVAIKNVNTENRRGGGIYLDGMNVAADTISIHNVGRNNDYDAVSIASGDGTIDQVVYGGTTSPSSWSDRGTVVDASSGSALQPTVPTEDQVGPGATTDSSTDSGSDTVTSPDPAQYGGYQTPSAGTVDWPVPLNENFETIEADVLALVQRIQTLEQQH